MRIAFIASSPKHKETLVATSDEMRKANTRCRRNLSRAGKLPETVSSDNVILRMTRLGTKLTDKDGNSGYLAELSVRTPDKYYEFDALESEYVKLRARSEPYMLKMHLRGSGQKTLFPYNHCTYANNGGAPHWAEILIHKAASPAELRGCIAPGFLTDDASLPLTYSSECMQILFDLMGGWSKGKLGGYLYVS